MKESQSSDVRRTALLILNSLDQRHHTLDRIMDETDERFPRRDRALLNSLVYGVLRWRGRLDWIIDRFSKTPPNRIDPEIHNILRLGLFQMLFLDKIPAFAAVNTSVELAKLSNLPWTARFVNGVLRNAVRGYDPLIFPDIDRDPVHALAALKSFPEWIIRRWLKRFGLEETISLGDSVNTIPPVTVRTNTLKTTRDALIKALEPDAESVESTEYAPEGIRVPNFNMPVSQLKAFQDGWFQVQDEAAQLITHLLNPQPGDTVLDACAGLGGKTGHIAQMMNNQGTVVAADSDEHRLLRLRAEMARLGVSIVSARLHDLNQPFPDPVLFDRILLDAPCSGMGVMRRNPDIKWSSDKKMLRRCQKRQLRFLNRLADMVKPSGCMVYAVCSTEPEETDDVTEEFLNCRGDFTVEKNTALHSIKALTDPDGCFRTFPHRHRTDGFFGVCLKRLPQKAE